MSNKNVRVEFAVPREMRAAGKSYFLRNGDSEIQLPAHLTTLHQDQGGMATAVTVPQWLAVKEGLLESDDESACLPSKKEDEMSRYDWFLLGTTMALIVLDEQPVNNAVWEARKITAKLMDTTKGD